MTQENVEIVRRIIEEGLPIDRDPEQLLDIWDPRGDYYPSRGVPRGAALPWRRGDCALFQRLPTGLAALRDHGQGDNSGP